jgi:hypothetical protein
MPNLYHGSSISGLKELKPNKAGHNKPYVYATDKLSLSCIFCASPRSSLEYRMGEDENETLIFCERFEGIFDKYYKNLSASIYVLDDKEFEHLDNIHPREKVCSKVTDVVEEIVIEDMKQYLLDMADRGEIILVPYEKRLEYFPNIDNELEDKIKKLIDKYGEKRIRKRLKNMNKDIVSKIESLS